MILIIIINMVQALFGNSFIRTITILSVDRRLVLFEYIILHYYTAFIGFIPFFV